MADSGTKRKALDIATKRAILTELSQGVKNCELVKKCDVCKSTISKILKNKDKIISADANLTDRKRLQRATYVDIGFCVANEGTASEPNGREAEVIPAGLRDALEEVSFNNYVDADRCAAVCGTITTDDIIAQVTGGEAPVIAVGADDDAALSFRANGGYACCAPILQLRGRRRGCFPPPNLPLQVTLYSALEMLKCLWTEVTATCVQNSFRKAGFIDVKPDGEPEASEENRSGGDL
ncbi:hypothetical protein HPB52_008913 [Rhipicephalus sanguineus]|uniref:HTH psq-type domain-containing protein n=1 Tax=Rhipicephalus sanguineus TaxID=34632 RepID=A0A9D4PZ36_RHISA|nr:hypothetical protein HPB52_008913 [Rhipicephalus sanguineus]